MKISIITVTKNNKVGLLRAIESVRSQTYKNVEHIIVDGMSKDGTVDVLRNLSTSLENNDSRELKYSVRWISEKDSGIYDAINKGLRLASGDIVGLLHSDDFYFDNFVIEKYVDYFVKNPVDAVYSDLIYIKDNTQYQKNLSNRKVLNFNSYKIIRYWKTHNKDNLILNPIPKIYIINGWMPPHPTLFVKKSVYDRMGLYKTDMRVAADYDMILRMFYVNKIRAGYIPNVTYCMGIGGNSNKSIKNIIVKSYEDYLSMRINGIPVPMYTLFLKNIRKITQFFNKRYNK